MRLRLPSIFKKYNGLEAEAGFHGQQSCQNVLEMLIKFDSILILPVFVAFQESFRMKMKWHFAINRGLVVGIVDRDSKCQVYRKACPHLKTPSSRHLQSFAGLGTPFQIK